MPPASHLNVLRIEKQSMYGETGFFQIVVNKEIHFRGRKSRGIPRHGDAYYGDWTSKAMPDGGLGDET